MKYELSIVIPGIRTESWQELYDSCVASCEDVPFELITIGPSPTPEFLRDKKNYRHIQDYGAPARCAQIGTLFAQGEIMTWGSDDGVFMGGSLKKCTELLKSLSREDGVIIRYSEGVGRSGTMPPDNYWTARTHADQRLPGVLETYKIAPVGMYYLDRFRTLGGWDCRFEHLNMCCHDLAFRLQKSGGKLEMSPDLTHICDFTPGSELQIPVQRAYHENDLPLFQAMYLEYDPARIKIDYNNWIDSPSVWDKRFSK